MNIQLRKPQSIQAVYLWLILGNTLAASFIWGINTIFLLDAGLTNFQAFMANAFFTLGQVLFEIPTGVIADTFGRRLSYLLGAFTLAASTILYFVMWRIHGPFWGWIVASMLLGLGFTFFSGALEAWLVDALHATNFTGSLDGVFAKGQMIGGAAMLTGSVAGGVIAEMSNLGVPYILRSLVLIANFATAFFLMKDLGFVPKKTDRPLRAMKAVFAKSVQHGFGNAPVRWLMLAAPFTAGVSFYIFYALQPFLLSLYGNGKAYGVAGLVAALAALAQIAGGILAPFLKKIFRTKTGALISGVTMTGAVLMLVALANTFSFALALIFLWGFLFAALAPIRQTYLNELIPSEERATVLSFDSLMGSSGGIFIQPVLGKIADVWSYGTSYMVGALVQFGALPFLLLARHEKTRSDTIET